MTDRFEFDSEGFKRKYVDPFYELFARIQLARALPEAPDGIYRFGKKGLPSNRKHAPTLDTTDYFDWTPYKGMHTDDITKSWQHDTSPEGKARNARRRLYDALFGGQ